MQAGDKINYTNFCSQFSAPGTSGYRSFRYSNGNPITSGTYIIQAPVFTVMVTGNISFKYNAMTSAAFINNATSFPTTSDQTYSSASGTIIFCHNCYEREYSVHGSMAVNMDQPIVNGGWGTTELTNIIKIEVISSSGGALYFYVGGIECVNENQYNALFKGKKIYYSSCDWWSIQSGATFASIADLKSALATYPHGKQIKIGQSPQKVNGDYMGSAYNFERCLSS